MRERVEAACSDENRVLTGQGQIAQAGCEMLGPAIHVADGGYSRLLEVDGYAGEAGDALHVDVGADRDKDNT
jgi:hypothetical protein